MPEITLPEVKLPDIKLPDNLRDMNKDDFVHAVRETKLPKKVKLPDIDLTKVEVPDAMLDRMPDSIADRMPGRRRTNPLIAFLAMTVVGLALAGIWWLVASPSTGPRVRRAVDDLKTRMNGERSDLIRYDDETDLGSLVGQGSTMSSPTTSDPYGVGSSYGEGVAVGPGITSAEEQARSQL
ncbi:MAG: hypothetical protein ACJ765_02025 [Chloroflexota bacterium]